MGKKSKVNTDEYEEASNHWFDDLPPLEESKPIPSPSTESTTKQLKLKERGKELLDQLANSRSKKNLSSDEKWMQRISSSGTTSDKIAAAVILIKEQPMSNLKSLQSLIAQSKKKGGKSNVPVVENLSELFVEDLLPPDRGLLYVFFLFCYFFL